jgi:glutamine synthetase
MNWQKASRQRAAISRNPSLNLSGRSSRYASPSCSTATTTHKNWHKEAEKRGLPTTQNTPAALKAMITDKALRLFEKYNVLSNVELRSRYTIRVEKYIKDLKIEAKAMINMISTEIIPAGIKYQANTASSISAAEAALGSAASLKNQKELLKKICSLIETVSAGTEELDKTFNEGLEIEDEQKKAEFFCNTVKVKMEELRESVDALELVVDDELWQLPKFWEMLFIN